MDPGNDSLPFLDGVWSRVQTKIGKREAIFLSWAMIMAADTDSSPCLLTIWPMRRQGFSFPDYREA